MPIIRLLGFKLKSKALLRGWLRKQVKRLAAAGENCLFYFRTIRLAHTLGPLLEHCGYRYVFEPHEVFYENAKDPDQFKQLEQTVYRQAAYLFPISHTLGQHLARKFDVRTPIVPGPLGHSGRNFALPDYDPTAPPRFLYTGSLHRWKGLELAFAATSEFKLPFDIVGDAGGLERCWDFCQANHYSHVIFHGQIPPEQLSGKYTTGSICLLPLSNEEIARSYTSPLKLFDYLAAGRPVVAGDLPTVREVVEDGVQARLVPVDDPAAWKKAFGDLLRDRTQAAQLARRGRDLAQRCTWSERAKALVPVLESLT